ncbi:protein-disulfide reductase DsbD domain-containing protein [uncultured Hyphomicrobium sp.]|uniref:protein-disulfide reductase DsbD domain-containing protein n=1 Tax=uncultured Hyphomicrobium sp. TaxID=194373 RepID=UPI0025EA8D53|nr:protein-disulfide reductase DsbD domain-containing protein [uncultured Hyphomicrobium sp.]
MLAHAVEWKCQSPKMSPKFRSLHLTLNVIFALVVAASSGWAASSPWVQAPKAKARLLVGGAAQGSSGSPLAFIEIALEPGWKTYWRTPGDAGGLPPSFDWSKSTNLAAATVAFPAPHRFTDKSGSTIGYMDELVLPVTLTPLNKGEPITLVVGVHYGICKDICIPVEAELALDVPAGVSEALPADVEETLKRVPRPQDNLAAGDPVLVRAVATLEGASPKIAVEATFAGDGAGADVFLEAPDGLFLPLPERVGDIDGTGRALFEAALGTDVDLAALKGKPVTVTLVSESGASFATFVAQ